MKLTPAQWDLLRAAVANERTGVTCVETYKPLLRLRVLGLVETTKLKWGNTRLKPTEAGKALCLAKASPGGEK